MDTSNLKKRPAGLTQPGRDMRATAQGGKAANPYFGSGVPRGGSLRAHNWSAQLGHVLGAADVGAKPDADDQRTHEMKKDVGHGSVLSEAASGGIETVGGSLKPVAGDLGGHSREAQAEAGEMSEVAHHGSGLLLSLADVWRYSIKRQLPKSAVDLIEVTNQRFDGLHRWVWPIAASQLARQRLGNASVRSDHFELRMRVLAQAADKWGKDCAHAPLFPVYGNAVNPLAGSPGRNIPSKGRNKERMRCLGRQHMGSQP